MIPLLEITVSAHVLSPFAKVQKSVSSLQSTGLAVPEIVIVAGSGLAASLPPLEKTTSISFSEISHFVKPEVKGHLSELRFGMLRTSSGEGKSVVIMTGRNHLYEGLSPAEVVHNLRSLLMWGAQGVVLTNAAGCLHSNWRLGNLMLISDQINYTGTSPLIGESGKEFGPLFVNVSDLYTKKWRESIQQTAKNLDVTLYQGTYYGVHGPAYETPAEIRAMQVLGADSVGMSTVLEALAAAQMNKKVAGLSCLTNYAAGLSDAVLEHEHVVQMSKQSGASIARIVQESVPLLN